MPDKQICVRLLFLYVLLYHISGREDGVPIEAKAHRSRSSDHCHLSWRSGAARRSDQHATKERKSNWDKFEEKISAYLGPRLRVDFPHLGHGGRWTETGMERGKGKGKGGLPYSPPLDSRQTRQDRDLGGGDL